MKFKSVILAGVIAVAAPVSAMAATISGEIGITGLVSNNGSFIADGGVTFDGMGNTGLATGDFAVIPAPAIGDVTLTDITFAPASGGWSVGGFTFVATSFSEIGDDMFNAKGTINGNGFDETIGILEFTTQGNSATATFSTTTTAVPVPAGILLMGTALAGFGVMRRKAKKAA